MSFIKIPALLALAAAALLVSAGSASATTVTGPSGEGTPTIHFVNEGGHVKIANPIATIECSVTGQLEIEQHGTGVTAKGGLTSLSWTGCTNSWHVTTVISGSLEFHYVSPGLGTVTWSGLTLNATRLGVNCNYATNNTHIGTLTDTTKTGGSATFDVLGLIPIHKGSSVLCGSGAAKIEGAWVSTTNLTLDP